MWIRSASEFHAGAWLLWLLAAMLAALSTRNPFYLVLITLSAVLGNVLLSKSKRHIPEDGISQGEANNHPYDLTKRGFRILLRAVAILLLILALFKGLSIHIGETVLFSLPEGWPLIGGPITLEGMAFAALDAISLTAVLAVFAVFSVHADYYALLRSVPPFMHQVGLVTSIAITFMPQSVIRFTEIREAQALRGHRVRHVRDLAPLVVPLLAGGMERSMNLAEAMEARGFSRSPAGTRKARPIYVQIALVFGLGLVLTGGALFALLADTPWIGWGCIALGISLLAITLWYVGKGIKRTRYRRGVWRDRDTALAIASLAIGFILLTYRLLAPATLVYDPLSRIRIYSPPFDVVIACMMLALTAPAIVARAFAPTASRSRAEIEGYAR